MRLGKVQVVFEYVVDLDNKDMVDHAKISIAEDIENTIKCDKIFLNGKTINILYETMDECKFLEKSDVAEFLLDNG